MTAGTSCAEHVLELACPSGAVFDPAQPADTPQFITNPTDVLHVAAGEERCWLDSLKLELALCGDLPAEEHSACLIEGAEPAF